MRFGLLQADELWITSFIQRGDVPGLEANHYYMLGLYGELNNGQQPLVGSIVPVFRVY